ncbi:ATP-grasp domain-containing protein [Oerskovia sp. M15]
MPQQAPPKAVPSGILAPVLDDRPGDRNDDTRIPDLRSGVVKPVGRNSSSGVVRFTSSSELRRQLLTYPSDEVLLVEEYVGGNEVSVEALVQDGRVIFSGITQKFVGTGFVEVGHEFPADLTVEQSDALLEANKQVLARLDFRDGISHAEFKVTPSGEVYLMEIAARFPETASSACTTSLRASRWQTRLSTSRSAGEPRTSPDPVRKADLCEPAAWHAGGRRDA